MWSVLGCVRGWVNASASVAMTWFVVNQKTGASGNQSFHFLLRVAIREIKQLVPANTLLRSSASRQLFHSRVLVTIRRVMELRIPDDV